MFYFMENPMIKWMIFFGSPNCYFGNPKAGVVIPCRDSMIVDIPIVFWVLSHHV